MTDPGSDHARIEEIRQILTDEKPDGDDTAPAGLGGHACGCYYDSGIYTVTCPAHNERRAIRDLLEFVAAAESELAGLRERTRRLEEALVWISDYPNRAHPDIEDDAEELAEHARETLAAARPPLREEDGTRDGMPITVTLEDLAAAAEEEGEA